ncbi:hypothetical protein Fcan01_10754 [Folsomia candida]|uniref:DUF4806 domain-containing protein n=1 Tax=Folsomia candida TaxID=158441 RepID=A0A226EBX2_FOLCA|nr:hypothetical protein Fcan01_10754 [Folsomia candida]
MASAKFSVVNFYKEKKVATVLTSWLDARLKYCAWPSGPCAADKLKTFAPPEKAWPKYPCKHIKFADSLEEANRYRDKAQFQSEVDSSAPESPHFSKTKPRRKKIQVKKPASFSADQESDSLSSNEEENVPTTNFLNLGESEIPSNTDTAPDDDNVEINGQEGGSSERQIEVVDDVSNYVVVPLQELENIKTELKNLQLTVAENLVKINGNLEELLRRSNLVGGIVEEIACDHPTLPVTTIENFDKLSEWIKTRENKIKLVAKLRILGGANSEEISKRVLDYLFAKNIAKIVTLTGVGKGVLRGFRDSGLIDLINSSVRATSGGEQFTTAKAEAAIKKWVKNKSDSRAETRCLGASRSLSVPNNENDENN